MFWCLGTFWRESRLTRQLWPEKRATWTFPGCRKALSTGDCICKGKRRTSLKGIWVRAFCWLSRTSWSRFKCPVPRWGPNSQTIMSFFSGSPLQKFLVLFPFLKEVHSCTIWKMKVFSLPEKEMKCLHSRRTQSMCKTKVLWKIQDLWNLFCAKQEPIVCYPRPPPRLPRQLPPWIFEPSHRTQSSLLPCSFSWKNLQ